MKSKTVTCLACVMFLLASISVADAVPQDIRALHFRGLINDYSLGVTGAPWEIHGAWSLTIYQENGTADFSAALTMSDYGTTATGAVDPSQPGQSAHTHNIQVTGATVTQDMTGCPTFKPPTKTGFQFTKTVSLLTANGSNAVFETNPPSSTLQVCITGGDEVPYSTPSSNITLVFAGPATVHFGMQPLHGVVRQADSPF